MFAAFDVHDVLLGSFLLCVAYLMVSVNYVCNFLVGARVRDSIGDDGLG